MSEAHARGSPKDTDTLMRALAHCERRAIVRRLASEPTVPKPETAAAHHVHVPLLVEANVVAENDGVLRRGRDFTTAQQLLSAVDD